MTKALRVQIKCISILLGPQLKESTATQSYKEKRWQRTGEMPPCAIAPFVSKKDPIVCGRLGKIQQIKTIV
jgi:hypothetical protein